MPGKAQGGCRSVGRILTNRYRVTPVQGYIRYIIDRRSDARPTCRGMPGSPGHAGACRGIPGRAKLTLPSALPGMKQYRFSLAKPLAFAHARHQNKT